MKTIFPCIPLATQFFTTRWVNASGAKTLTSKLRRTRSRGISAIGPPSPMPALLTRMSKSHLLTRDIVSIEQVKLLDTNGRKRERFRLEPQRGHLRPCLSGGDDIMSVASQ